MENDNVWEKQTKCYIYLFSLDVCVHAFGTARRRVTNEQWERNKSFACDICPEAEMLNAPRIWNRHKSKRQRGKVKIENENKSHNFPVVREQQQQPHSLNAGYKKINSILLRYNICFVWWGRERVWPSLRCCRNFIWISGRAKKRNVSFARCACVVYLLCNNLLCPYSQFTLHANDLRAYLATEICALYARINIW